MTFKKNYQVVLRVLLLISLVIGLSYFSTKVWNGKAKTHIEVPVNFQFITGESLAQFGKANQIPENVLLKALGVKDKSSLLKSIIDLCMGLSAGCITRFYFPVKPE